jgi:hypothetical protein
LSRSRVASIAAPVACAAAVIAGCGGGSSSSSSKSKVAPVGPWKLAGHKLAPRELGSIDLIKTSPSEGLLGADVMKEFVSVVFDYAGGRLLLGAN